MSADSLEERLQEIPSGMEIPFLEEFLFQLTIAFRTVHGTESLESEAMINALSMINEINHRVLTRIMMLKSGDDSLGADYLAKTMRMHVHQAPAIAGWVGAALNKASSRYKSQT